MWRPLPWFLATLFSVSAVHAASPPEVAARGPQAEQSPQAVTTEAFLRHTAAVIKFQVASSQLALRKTKSAIVQDFAHQMVLDYSAAGMKFRQAVADAKIPPPREMLDESHKALSDELGRTLPGKPFAKAYVEAQSKALHDDLELFKAYARSGDNERLKYFAQEMVPLLRGQLDQLARLRR
jgi:putative membrane protein